MYKVYLPETNKQCVDVTTPPNTLMIGIRESLGGDANIAYELPFAYRQDALKEIIRVALAELETAPDSIPENLLGIYPTPNTLGCTHSIVRLKGSSPLSAFESWTDDGGVAIHIKEGAGHLVPRKLAYGIKEAT